MSLPITTARLVLRRFSHQDIGDVVELVSHPSVGRETPEIEATESGARKYIDFQNRLEPFQQGKCFDLAIERQVDGKVIGLLSIVCQRHRQGEIGYALGIAHRGQGYATEAAGALAAYGFDTLQLHRIFATTNSDNNASWRVMERLGMRREGCLREAAWRDERWWDKFIYAILAHEWSA
jgi:ribosomal-protein-alanine N-acetyltransferase